MQYYKQLKPRTDQFERNPWLRELWREKFECEFDSPEGSLMNKSVYYVHILPLFLKKSVK